MRLPIRFESIFAKTQIQQVPATKQWATPTLNQKHFPEPISPSIPWQKGNMKIAFSGTVTFQEVT